MTIREIRDLTGLSQAAFAEKCNIPRRTIENWESGHSKCPDYISAMLEQLVTLNLYATPINGEPIKNLREEIGMSQEEFSQKYQIPLRTLKDWESEKHKCPGYVSELIERCVRHDALPFYFCVVKIIHPTKSDLDFPSGAGGNFISYRGIMHPCTLEYVTAEYAYPSEHKCELQRDYVNKHSKSSYALRSPEVEICVMRSEEVIELISQL